MPFSAPEGKDWAVERLRRYFFSNPQHEPIRFLDIGVGAGAWLDAVKPHFPNSLWTGIEIWEPYVERFDLKKRYDRIIVDDVRGIVLPEADVIIWGDVLEHMTEEEASVNYDRSFYGETSPVVIGSVPIIHYPQGAEEGNPYEVHVQDHLTEDKVKELFAPDLMHVGEVVATWVHIP